MKLLLMNISEKMLERWLINMAKKEHQENVTGGLTEGLNFTAPAVPAQGESRPQIPNIKHQTTANPLTKGYQQVHKGKIETRSAKLNILVKRSTAEKLDEAVNNGDIRSRNDLINYLLEKYFEEKIEADERS